MKCKCPPAPCIVLIGSVAALALALISQYGFGYHPCELCIWQRWAYAGVIVVAILAHQLRLFKYLLPLAVFAVTGIAAFHFGVEQKWWEGFSTCSSGFNANSIEELKAQIMGAPVVRCDEVAWTLLGLSMAGWNVLYSAALGFYASYSLLIRGRAG